MEMQIRASGTDVCVYEITLTEGNSDICLGSVIFAKLGRGKQTSRWTARKRASKHWDISGEGAFLPDGSHADAQAYPFLMDPLANQGIAQIIADWLNEKAHHLVCTVPT